MQKNKKTHNPKGDTGLPKKANVNKAIRSAFPETSDKRIWIGLIIVILITLISFWPCLHNGLVMLDDEAYIIDNPIIRQFNILQMFTSYWMGNYHPFVMMVYAWIYSFVHTDPAAYHAVNLILHVINTSLVLFVIYQICGKPEVALFVSLLFGIQPMHVESVAWVSGLKDLLYTAFFLAALYCYTCYIKRELNKRYLLLTLVFFLASLLSKGMGVSLPLVLLLFDYYYGRKFNSRCFLEKIPFFMLSLVFGILAIKAQASSGAIQVISEYPFYQRFVFACSNYITYLIKLIIPFNLSAYYPYPIGHGENLSAVYYLYPLLLVLLALIAVIYFRKSSALIFGLGFFTAAIFLVLQLFPVGEAVMADRYSYLASVGFYFFIGNSLFRLLEIKSRRTILFTAVGILTITYGVITYQRCQVWNNSMTLFNSILEKNDVPVILVDRGKLFFGNGEYEKSVQDYSKAIKLAPEFKQAYSNRGLAFTLLTRFDEAMVDLDKAISLDASYAEAYNNRGALYDALQKPQEAFGDFSKAIELNPKFAMAWCNRGLNYCKTGNLDLGIDNFTKAIQLDPNLARAYRYRGLAYADLKHFEMACPDLRTALKLGDKDAASIIQSVCR